MDVHQVATSGSQSRLPHSGAKLSEEEDEGAIEEFFGQLWWVPRSPPPRVSQHPPNLL
jgi:hypothetical protein